MSMKSAKKSALFFLLLLLIACSNQTSTEEIANDIIEHLLHGEVEVVHKDYFSEQLQATLAVEELWGIWESHLESADAFQEVAAMEVSRQGENTEVVEGFLQFEKMDIEVRLIFNKNQQLVGINLSEGELHVTMPSTINEEVVTLGVGTDYELEGILTLPKDEQEKLPAVVLVHGSGSSDKDEAVFGYKPFRDLAWGLAEQGIASIRYDKRTYTYGKEMQDLDKLTVYEESVEDAIFATKLLKKDARIDESNVYLVGHSLGGMLAPRIDVQGGNYAGLVMLAGTPRPLWEVIYDQNLLVIEQAELEESKEKEQLKLVEAEYEKAKQLQELSNEEANEMTVFGINAYYLKEMDEYNVETIVKDIEKPMLILQGEDDFQVYYEKDYFKWQEVLSDNQQTTFISYPGLNHFFVDYKGPNEGTVAEYESPGRIEVDVIEDIATWILKQNR